MGYHEKTIEKIEKQIVRATANSNVDSGILTQAINDLIDYKLEKMREDLVDQINQTGMHDPNY